MIRRPPKSTQSRSSAASNGYKRQVQGTAPALLHYFDMIGEWADSTGTATPLLDRAAELYRRFIDMGFADYDVARMVEVIESLPRSKT